MNEDEYEQYQQNPQLYREMGLPPTETSVDLMKLILFPQDKTKVHITKDLAISNLSKEEIRFVFNNLELIHLLHYIETRTGWDLNDLISRVVDADIKGFMQVTRSKGGFERLAEISKHMKTTQTFREDRPKRLF